MNRRNDVFHGNVDPKKLFFDEVYFDGKIPLFKKMKSFAERRFLAQFNTISPEDILKDLESVRAFIEYVIGHLEPDHAQGLLRVMEDEEPGWRQETGNVAILFSEFADMF